MRDNRIRKLVIVGGGTAGWMAAAALRRHFQGGPLEITLVESSEIGTIGVGEATIPTIRGFYQQLGLTDIEVMQATQATCKLGIRFDGWVREGQSFIHPFGLFGQDLRGVPFHHYWRKLSEAGEATDIADYSLGASLARAGKFMAPQRSPSSPLAIFDWALHFDAGLFAQLMRRVAEDNGVRRVDAKITQVKLDPENGHVASLDLDTGATIEGDLFIDCSGFRGLLIEEALHTGYESWSDVLLCDRAWAVQSEGSGEPPPYTDVTAHSAGWRWRIPLQHRYGNGYVFSSRHISEADALAELKAAVPDLLLHEPRLIRFNPGRRQQGWNRNVIALGLSSGFLEPLESTSIALIETGIEKIKALFPDRHFAPELADEFNDWSRREMERVRDFIILHYWANKRGDTPFWRACNAVALPDALKRKIDLWTRRGHFIRYRWEMFHPASWLAIYAGFELLPETIDPALDGIDPQTLSAPLAEMRKAIAEVVASAPPHAAFLNQYCRPAPQPDLSAPARSVAAQ